MKIGFIAHDHIVKELPSLEYGLHNFAASTNLLILRHEPIAPCVDTCVNVFA